MKMGTVLYLTDAAGAADFDDELALLRLGLSPDWAVVAAEDPGYFSMHDATRLLIERGASRIEAVRARIGQDGDMVLFGDVMHLYG